MPCFAVQIWPPIWPGPAWSNRSQVDNSSCIWDEKNWVERKPGSDGLDDKDEGCKF